MSERRWIPVDQLKYDQPDEIGMSTMVGRKTGRIRGFEIDIDALEAPSVSSRLKAVQQALAGARKHAHPPHPDPWSRIELNSHVADKILQDRHAEVFTPVAP